MSFDEILKRAAALPPRSAIFFVLMSVDATEASHEGSKAFPRLHAVAGGKVWAENHLRGGAVFRFTLPLARPRTA